jgi:hypothetical protein
VVEAMLEVPQPQRDVGEIPPRAQLGEQSVRSAERLQRVSVAPERKEELRLLARRFGGEQKIFARHRLLVRHRKERLGLDQLV